MLTASKVIQTFGITVQVDYSIKSDVGQWAHLTMYWHCRIKADHVEDYGQKSGYARNGVDL